MHIVKIVDKFSVTRKIAGIFDEKADATKLKKQLDKELELFKSTFPKLSEYDSYNGDGVNEFSQACNNHLSAFDNNFSESSKIVLEPIAKNKRLVKTPKVQKSQTLA